MLCDVRVLVGVRARAARALYHVSGSLFSFCALTRHVQTCAKRNNTRSRTRGNMSVSWHIAIYVCWMVVDNQ